MKNILIELNFKDDKRKVFKSSFYQISMNKGRKISGGKYHANRKSKSYEIEGIPRIVKLREKKMKVLRTRGGNEKNVLLSCNVANITDKKGKTKKAKITNVIETHANRFLARQNILIKGGIIDTELGKAKITNRPSQEGSVNAVLVD